MTTATTYTRLTLDDLGGLEAGRRSGNNRRFLCPVHGGDHQLSLSIVDEGEYAGLGTCHNCHAKVIITDWPGRPEGKYKPPTQAERVQSLLTPKLPSSSRTTPPGNDCVKLREWHPRMVERARSARPVDYLAGRGLPLASDDLALFDVVDVGYVPASAKLPRGMSKWADRLIFPLWSPVGRGYAGRCLWGWRPGMDENEHKVLLNAHDKECETQKCFNEHTRWLKTMPAGWYCADGQFSETVIIVEGPLDRLALLAAGCDPDEVIALVGTAMAADSIEWLPRHVKYAVLAFDGDGPGQERANDTAILLSLAGITPAYAIPPDDDLGKDASERYRLGGLAGLAYIFEAHAHLVAPLVVKRDEDMPICSAAPAEDMYQTDAKATPIVQSISTVDDDDLMTQLFRYAPWYRVGYGSVGAAIQASYWIFDHALRSDDDPEKTLADMPKVERLLSHVFALGDPLAVTLDGRSRRLPLDLLVVKLRDAFRDNRVPAICALLEAMEAPLAAVA